MSSGYSYGAVPLATGTAVMEAPVGSGGAAGGGQPKPKLSNRNKGLLAGVGAALAVALVAVLVVSFVKPANADVAVDEQNFPDPVFRAYVSDNIDANHDGMLSDDEMANVTTVDVSHYARDGAKVSDLTGIGHFQGLHTLNASHCDLYRMPPDFHECHELRVVDVTYNYISETIDVTENRNLVVVYVGGNQEGTQVVADPETNVVVDPGTDMGNDDNLGGYVGPDDTVIEPIDVEPIDIVGSDGSVPGTEIPEPVDENEPVVEAGVTPGEGEDPEDSGESTDEEAEGESGEPEGSDEGTDAEPGKTGDTDEPGDTDKPGTTDNADDETDENGEEPESESGQQAGSDNGSANSGSGTATTGGDETDESTEEPELELEPTPATETEPATDSGSGSDASGTSNDAGDTPQTGSESETPAGSTDAGNDGNSAESGSTDGSNAGDTETPGTTEGATDSTDSGDANASNGDNSQGAASGAPSAEGSGSGMTEKQLQETTTKFMEDFYGDWSFENGEMIINEKSVPERCQKYIQPDSDLYKDFSDSSNFGAMSDSRFARGAALSLVDMSVEVKDGNVCVVKARVAGTQNTLTQELYDQAVANPMEETWKITYDDKGLITAMEKQS